MATRKAGNNMKYFNGQIPDSEVGGDVVVDPNTDTKVDPTADTNLPKCNTHWEILTGAFILFMVKVLPALFGNKK